VIVSRTDAHVWASWTVRRRLWPPVREMPLADPAGLLWRRLEGPSRRCFIGEGRVASICSQPRDAIVSDIMFGKILGHGSAVIALAATLEAKGIGNVADLQSHVEAMIRRLAATSPQSLPPGFEGLRGSFARLELRAI